MSSRYREIIKSAILVVLLIVTILLLYLIYQQKSSSGLSLRSLLPIGDRESGVTAAECISARDVWFSIGDGGFYRAERGASSLTGKFSALAFEAAGSAGITLSDISRADYEDAVGAYRSVRLEFAYSLPLKELLDSKDIKYSSSINDAVVFDAAAFSEASRASIILADRAGGRYYRLILEGEADIFSELYAEAVLEGSVYYRTGEVVGSEGEALIPLTKESGMEGISFSRSRETDPDFTSETAEAIFGENFDFVRRISDGQGNLTYMYGYGVKTLTVSDGVFEYRAVASASESEGLLGDLQTALDFAERCGGFKEAGRFVLSGIRTGEAGGLRTHEFSFCAVSGGEPVYAQDGAAIRVEVSGGDVTYYRRDVCVYEEAAGTKKWAAASAANTIAANAEKMLEFINASPNTDLNITPGEGPGESPDADPIGAISEELEWVGTGYYHITGGEGSQREDSVVPAWVMETSSARMFFDLYSGEMLGAEER